MFGVPYIVSFIFLMPCIVYSADNSSNSSMRYPRKIQKSPEIMQIQEQLLSKPNNFSYDELIRICTNNNYSIFIQEFALAHAEKFLQTSNAKHRKAQKKHIKTISRTIAMRNQLKLNDVDPDTTTKVIEKFQMPTYKTKNIPTDNQYRNNQCPRCPSCTIL